MTTAAPDARRGLSRAVVWTGIALGTCLAVMAIRDGARLRVGGMPSWLGVFLGGLIVWALIAGASVVLAELVRRHHKTAARYAARQGKRGALAAGQGARRHGGRLAAAAASWAEPRWQARTDAKRPGLRAAAPGFLARWQAARAARAASAGTSTASPAPAGAGGQDAPSAPAPAGTDGNPATSTTGGNTMTNPAGPGPAGRRPARRQPAGGDAAGAWKQLTADTSSYEPEDDGDLLAWMASETTGMSMYAEAITDVYETAVNSVGLDPVAMNALHDYAEAAADAASAMAAARSKFASHYAEVREFAANGGLLPFNGRWMTGDGDA